MQWNSTIREVKGCIGRKFNIPSDLLRLDHCSKPLEDSVEIHSLTAHEILVLNVQRHDIGLLGGVKRNHSCFKCPICSRVFQKYESALSHERQCRYSDSSVGFNALTDLIKEQSDGNDKLSPHNDDMEVASMASQESLPQELTLEKKSERNADTGLPFTDAHAAQEGSLSELETVVGQLVHETGESDVRDVIETAIDDEVITGHMVITRNLMDDIRFRQVCLDHGLSNRAATDVIHFIKTSESDLSTLRHPRTVMRKIMKSHGMRQKWETRAVQMTGERRSDLSVTIGH